jgi:hypothetical protein
MQEQMRMFTFLKVERTNCRSELHAGMQLGLSAKV